MASEGSVFAALEHSVAKYTHETQRLNREIARVGVPGDGDQGTRRVSQLSSGRSAALAPRQPSPPPTTTAAAEPPYIAVWSTASDDNGPFTLDEKLGLGVAATLAVLSVVFVIVYYTVLRNDISPAATTTARLGKWGSLSLRSSANGLVEVTYDGHGVNNDGNGGKNHDDAGGGIWSPGEWRVSFDGGATFPEVVASATPHLAYPVPTHFAGRELYFRLVDAHDPHRYLTTEAVLV